MDLIFEGTIKAFWLLVTFDPEVMSIMFLSLKISGSATLVSLFIGLSAGSALALTQFPGKKIVVGAVNTGMGLPPVVVGLFVSIFLWRSGPLGSSRPGVCGRPANPLRWRETKLPSPGRRE